MFATSILNCYNEREDENIVFWFQLELLHSIGMNSIVCYENKACFECQIHCREHNSANSTMTEHGGNCL